MPFREHSSTTKAEENDVIMTEISLFALIRAILPLG